MNARVEKTAQTFVDAVVAHYGAKSASPESADCAGMTKNP